MRELKTLGISVYFEKENIDTGEVSSEMMLAIYSQFAQEESMSISKNCRLGVRKRMMDGTYKTASAPFGYDYVDGKLKTNPEKAKIVNQIFSWYANGIGVEEISARLSIFQPAIDITDQALGKERTDLITFISTL